MSTQPNGAAATTTRDITRYQDPDVIREILHTARTVAIVGLSADVLRPSHFVGFYAQRHGYRVVPVNPRETIVLGETSYPSLLDVPVKVDVVDVFRRPDAVPEIARQAVQIGAKALWLQFGVISWEGAEIAEAGGLKVVMDRCFKVEHARHMGRMHWHGLNTGVITARRGSPG
jgi:predicted CoA-binding protein